MEYIELSLENVEEKTKILANKIKDEDFNTDVVIFIARGAFQIGKVLSDELNCPLLEIHAKRKGNKIKELLKPILKLIPKKLKFFLRDKEFNSNYHEKKVDRIVWFDENKWKKYSNCKNIIIVDDSVDTGNTILEVRDKIKEYFKNCSNIKIAALNFFKKSEKKIKTDYYIYVDTMLNGPWSNDSKYNNEFIRMYDKYKEEE